jgi:plastocyanin
MNSLDSRFLRLGDCFAQKFSKPGTFKYIVTAGTGSCLSAAEGEYTIVVTSGSSGKAKGKEKKSSESGQQNVVVRLKDGSLVAEPTRLEISVGDTVLWHTPDAATPGFAVIGEGKEGSFSSGALAVEAVYSHAFGVPGKYQWVDAHGSSLRGEIIVEQMEVKQRDDCRKWIDSLSKGTLIHVVGGKAEPSKVKIIAGQTVFWAVEKAAGISITDSRLVRKAGR